MNIDTETMQKIRNFVLAKYLTDYAPPEEDKDVWYDFNQQYDVNIHNCDLEETKPACVNVYEVDDKGQVDCANWIDIDLAELLEKGK